MWCSRIVLIEHGQANADMAGSTAPAQERGTMIGEWGSGVVLLADAGPPESAKPSGGSWRQSRQKRQRPLTDKR